MMIQNFKAFSGQHCETTATGSLLYQLGIELSEPMLFGLGEGLSFLIWKMKFMELPFLGGRVKTDLLTQNICRNLNLQLQVQETASIKKAWKNIEEPLLNNKVVGLKLDCYHLNYFTSKFHFAGHYVAMYGFDEEHAYLVDTKQQGAKVKTTLKSLELARNERGPMSSRNRSYTISRKGKLNDLNKAIKIAIHNNAEAYLNPPIKNFSYKGILKTSTEIKKWFRTSENAKADFQVLAMLMERAGTGGALFRNLYRDFIFEASQRLENRKLKQAHKDFLIIASDWKKVSDLFYEAGTTGEEKYITKASKLLVELSQKEKKIMELLSSTTF